MLKRDFSTSNKQYFLKNKWALLGVSLFIILGVIVAAIFGFNGNFEFKGYYEVEMNVGLGSTSTYANKAGNIINSFGGKFEGYQVMSVGENTTVVLRYMQQLDEDKQKQVNEKIEQLSTDTIKISIVIHDGYETGHVKVGSSVTNKEYLFTALAIIVILVISSVFTYVRHKGASAVTLIMSCLLATIGYLCLTAILRLSIGKSYFVMLIILNLLVAISCLGLFENIKETSWLQASNYAQALEDGLKKSKLRLCVLSIAVFVVGLLFAFISPSSLKYIALCILFISVMLLAVMLYAVPFIWSSLITYGKKNSKAN